MVAAETDRFVEGVITHVTFENDESGFRVLRLETRDGAQEILVGRMQKLHPGARVRAQGSYVNDAKFGRQLKVASLTELMPDTLAGMEKYLASGLISGVGIKTAERIVQAFGLETMRVLDEEPWRLRQIPGLGKAKAEAIANDWAQQRGARDVMVFLQSHGISPALAQRVYKRYGADAARLVREDPYRLSLEIWGIGFATADRIAQSLGLAKDDPKRLTAGLFFVLQNAKSSGHTYLEEEELDEHARALLQQAPGEIAPLVDSLVARELVVREERAIYLASMHRAEVRLGQRLLDLAAGRARMLAAEPALAEFERQSRMQLAEAQIAALKLAAGRNLTVITGGPGVGKTTLVRALLTMLHKAKLNVLLAAPTGRAAKRMQEATGQAAMTLHRLLEIDPRRGVFQRNGESPLEGDALIVDETSMLDLELACALFEAVPSSMRVILVGDVDQLPSVGPGAVLRDVIESGVVPFVRLSTIFRQGAGSLITENAHRINAGEMPEAATAGQSSDFYFIERKEAPHAQRTVLDLVQRHIPGKFGLDPLRDIQVLTPMHRGEVGTQELNLRLQAALNSSEQQLQRRDRVFRLGDKVMQLKNDYDREVYNGDVGFVSAIDAEAGGLRVRFDDREVECPGETLDMLSLAYATSIHKSQGSEYPAVVLPILRAHHIMLTRNLLYTGVTRGKRLVIVVGDSVAVARAVGRDGSHDRHTGLARRLREGTVAWS